MFKEYFDVYPCTCNQSLCFFRSILVFLRVTVVTILLFLRLVFTTSPCIVDRIARK